jgi:hypothetical protein
VNPETKAITDPSDGEIWSVQRFAGKEGPGKQKGGKDRPPKNQLSGTSALSLIKGYNSKGNTVKESKGWMRKGPAIAPTSHEGITKQLGEQYAVYRRYENAVRSGTLNILPKKEQEQLRAAKSAGSKLYRTSGSESYSKFLKSSAERLREGTLLRSFAIERWGLNIDSQKVRSPGQVLQAVNKHRTKMGKEEIDLEALWRKYERWEANKTAYVSSDEENS